jgi:hypothetical protein
MAASLMVSKSILRQHYLFVEQKLNVFRIISIVQNYSSKENFVVKLSNILGKHDFRLVFCLVICMGILFAVIIRYF